MRTNSYDLVIRNGRVVTPVGVEELDIGIHGTRVAAIGAVGSLPGGLEEIDARGTYVIPGGIDTHTHAYWPLNGSRRSRDTFASAGEAAARGGTTTMIDFVPRVGSESLIEAADRRLAEIDGSPIDIALHPIIDELTDQTLREVPELISRGLSSFKIYTTYHNRLSHGDIGRAMLTIHEHGGLAGFHAEDHDVLSTALVEVQSAGDLSLPHFPRSRPAWSESAAISRICQRAAELGAPVYFYHLSGNVALRAVEAARSQDIAVYAETCTHYLVETEEVFKSPDGWKYTITPPVRSAASREQLWRAVADGGIQAIGSDHCAYARNEKVSASEDFTSVPYGAPGIEARMPILWSEGVAKGRINVEQFVEITATRPSKLFGLHPKKGAIKVGADADIVLMDPKVEWEWPALS